MKCLNTSSRDWTKKYFHQGSGQQLGVKQLKWNYFRRIVSSRLKLRILFVLIFVLFTQVFRFLVFVIMQKYHTKGYIQPSKRRWKSSKLTPNIIKLGLIDQNKNTPWVFVTILIWFYNLICMGVVSVKRNIIKRKYFKAFVFIYYKFYYIFSFNNFFLKNNICRWDWYVYITKELI